MKDLYRYFCDDHLLFPIYHNYLPVEIVVFDYIGEPVLFTITPTNGCTLFKGNHAMFRVFVI